MNLFAQVTAKHGYIDNNLPAGVILATCKLSSCFKVTEDLGMAAFLDNGEMVTDNEYYFGDFNEG
jgi:outer membrane translocation and assembly module TamA